MPPSRDTADVVIVGGGAAGLATAVFCARATNTDASFVPTARELSGQRSSSAAARAVMSPIAWSRSAISGVATRASSATCCARFPASRAAEFFDELGVALHEEEDGKLFPDTNRARTVLDALVHELKTRAPSFTPRGASSLLSDPIARLSLIQPRAIHTRRTWWCSRPADARCRKQAATAPATASRSGSDMDTWRRRRRWCR